MIAWNFARFYLWQIPDNYDGNMKKMYDLKLLLRGANISQKKKKNTVMVNKLNMDFTNLRLEKIITNNGKLVVQFPQMVWTL